MTPLTDSQLFSIGYCLVWPYPPIIRAMRRELKSYHVPVPENYITMAQEIIRCRAWINHLTDAAPPPGYLVSEASPASEPHKPSI